MRFLAPPHQWFLKLTLLKIELWVYALHLIPVLLFQQKGQVLEPIKMPHDQLAAVPSRHRPSFRHCCFLFLFRLLLCALAGDYSLPLQDGELGQISMPSLLKGKQVAGGPCRRYL
jgi:hypothetical protein